MMPEIVIDKEKCTTPFECKKCLQICPQAVFMVLPTGMHTFRENEPEEYKLLAVFRDKCVSCNDCVEVCPVGAIQVKVILGGGE